MKFNEKGQGLVEYSLLILWLVAVITAILTYIGYSESAINEFLCSLLSICS